MIATDSPNMEERSPSESDIIEIDEKLATEIMSCGSNGSRSSPVNRAPPSKGKDGAPLLSQKEREEKIRQFREQQEEERRRRLYELQHATVQAQKYREQLEDERRRKIEDLRLRELERRQGVEERKRMIWEAEQERKEAILRRNLEREARIEARRNAQRNSMSFAFGSSTPRTFDLDLAALGPARTQNSVLFSASSNKRTDEREIDSTRRYSGADGFDRKPGDDPMSRSMISLSSASRARRKTDLTPALPQDHTTSRSRSPGNHGKRAVSMTRLDQLAQPRRKHTGVSMGTSSTNPVDGPRTISPSMSKSMYNIPNNFASSRSNHQFNIPLGSKGTNAMSKSMLHLAGPVQRVNKSSPSCPSARTPSPSQPFPNKHLSQSMIHLAITPRPTRASRLRADARTAVCKEGQASSTQTFNRSTGSDFGRLALSVLSSKETPSRPRSSMSATSEQSITSSQVSATSVKMRSGPRRIRPVSIGGVPSSNSAISNQQQSRQGRSTERKAVTPTTRHYRAKSAGQPENKQTLPVIRRPAANQKSPKTAKPTSDIPSKDNDRADSPLIKTPDLSLSPEPDVLQTKDRHSPEIDILQTGDRQSPGTDILQTRDRQLSEEIVTDDLVQESLPVAKPRISSEEEAKAALAEKRRLAREQAEREAELERQRQEELRRQEEERKRQEEEAQRKFEEEQIRLAEMHRLQEEEKLKKAIEEQKQREEEERERLEEETKLRVEKEEQERKAREEAEKQRKELEERLRREEAERAERKKRVEQIMSRTRKSGSTPTHSSSQGNSKLSSPEEEHKPLPASSPETTADQMVEVKSDNEMLSSVQSSIPCKDVDAFVPVTKSSPAINGQAHLQEDLKNWNPFAEQSYQQENNPFIDGNSHSTGIAVKEYSQQNLSSSECLLKASDSGVILADHSPDKVKIDNIPQPNGYNHHDEDRSFTDSMSPEEKSENSVGVLLDFGPISTPSPSQNFTQQIVSTEFDELIDIGASTTNQNEVNLLNNVDEVNSNKVPGNPFIAFEEPITRKQDSSLADLLS